MTVDEWRPIKRTPESDKLEGRLYNWKFSSALRYLDGQPDNVREAVKALSDCFGDCGCLSGSVSAIIASLVHALINGRVANYNS